MTMKNKYDWELLLAQCVDAVSDPENGISDFPALAEEVGIPRSTLTTGLRREFEIKSFEQLLELVPDDAKGDALLSISDLGPNKKRIICQSTRITSPEELLAFCKIDTDVWQIADEPKPRLNVWEMGRKHKIVDLKWDEGVPDGFVKDDGEWNKEQFIQIKLCIIRKKPIPVHPTIQPILCEVEYKPPKPVAGDVLTTVITSDKHYGYEKDIFSGKLKPFHDRVAIDLARQLIAYIQPDRVDELGDGLDMTMWTDKYARMPEFRFTTQPALAEYHWDLRMIRESVPDAEMRVHQGNHELRLDKMLVKHLEEMYLLKAVDEFELPPSMSIQRLLALHKLCISWVPDYPDDEDWLNDVIFLKHGNKAKQPGATARAMSTRTDCIEISGHIHRFEATVRKVHTRHGDKIALGYCVPCLCKTDGSVPGSNKNCDWSKGILKLDYAPESSYYSLTHIPFIDGFGIYDGKVFEGRDRIEEIKAAYPQYNW